MKKKVDGSEHVKIWLLVLDVLKPHEPSTLGIAKALNAVAGVDGVEISVNESNREVENAKITLEGEDIPYERVRKVIKDHGATIHSVEKVITGKKPPIATTSQNPDQA